MFVLQKLFYEIVKRVEHYTLKRALMYITMEYIKTFSSALSECGARNIVLSYHSEILQKFYYSEYSQVGSVIQYAACTMYSPSAHGRSSTNNCIISKVL
jgi:hypothetical protein